MPAADHRVVVVIGAQKAATSTLAALLDTHSQVAFTPGEFHDFAVFDDAAKSADRLATLFAELPPAQLRGFKCASYLGQPVVAARLRRALPDGDVVVILRDPVQRAVSAWYWYVRTGYVPIRDHERGIRALLAGDVDAEQWPHAAEVLQWGKYGEHLAAWYEEFPRERVHVLREDIVRTPRESPDLARLQETLGLAPEPLGPVPRANEGIYSMTRLRWLRLRRYFVWFHDADGIWRTRRPRNPVKWVLDTFVVGVDRVLLSRVFTRRVSISPELAALLADYYRADQELLTGVLADAG